MPFGLLKRKQQKSRVFVLGLDGAPLTLLKTLMERGVMPHFAQLVQEGDLKPSMSVVPFVSSVAWASFMTGCNPARHGVFGFVDRNPRTLEIFLPNANTLKAKMLWEILSGHDKRSIVINVPTNYPPRNIKGWIVAGFDAPNLEKATHPAELATKLRDMGYRLDIDAWKARESKDHLLEDLDITLKKRAQFALECLDREPWDFFILHIMGTDRLHHFLFEEFETNHPKYAPAFMEYYSKVDSVIGEIVKRLDDNVTLFVLSDHGFCTMKKEVSLNYYLQQQGFLQMKDGGKSLADMLPTSKAYSLIPGRIYVNLRGRERDGSVSPGSEYEEVREAVTESLRQLKDPDTGEPIVSHVLRREDVYSGACYDQAPDLVAMPHDGYDLKGNFNAASLTEKGAMTGTHTFDNAMLYVRGRQLRNDGLSVMDVAPAVLDIFGIQADGMDGKSCLVR